jgi:methylmalonyl-CoA/ethylmalonyl-CoA epimerase
MTNDELKAFNATRKIYQIAWVTRDIEKSLKAWVENLKVGPWKVFSFTDETVRNLKVGGKPVTEPFKFLIAISWMGDTEVEIIQPVYGPTIYQRFIDEKGEGLHHIKEKVEEKDFEAVLAGYKALDIGVTQTGQFFADFHFYLDTEKKLDFIYELGNCPVQDVPAGMYTVYPPE